MDIDNLQDPDEFFAAHERRESNLKLSFFFGVLLFLDQSVFSLIVTLAVGLQMLKKN